MTSSVYISHSHKVHKENNSVKYGISKYFRKHFESVLILPELLTHLRIFSDKKCHGYKRSKTTDLSQRISHQHNLKVEETIGRSRSQVGTLLDEFIGREALLSI